MQPSLHPSKASVKSGAQKNGHNSRPLPKRRGGYRTWNYSERAAIRKALAVRLMEEGRGRADAWHTSYQLLKRQWLDWLRPEERKAYRADDRRARTLPTQRERVAFWTQPAQEGRGA